MNGKLAAIAIGLALLASAAGTAEAASWDREPYRTGRQVQHADRRSDQNEAREGVREGRILPLGKVLANVYRRFPGRLLDAQLVSGGGRPIYLIKLMRANGVVALVSADAATGRILDYREGGR